MNMRLRVLVVIVMGLSLGGLAQDAPKKDAPKKDAAPQEPDKWTPGLHKKAPTSDTFDVDLFIPDAYAQEATRRFPILFMHDTQGKPNLGAFKDWANRMSVILLGVNGAENGPGGPIAARQKAAVAFAEKELRLSDCLRFSMGMSGAAMMSWLLCNNYSEKHAGILMMGQAGFETLPPKHVAVAYIHGDKEPNLPFIVSAMKRLAKAGNPLKEVVRPGGHIAGEHSDQVEMLTWMVNLERFTHPKRSPEEIKAAKDEAVKRIGALGAIADPAARFQEAEGLLTIPGVDTWPEAKALFSLWLKAAMEKATAMNDAVSKHEFLSDIENDPHLKGVPSAETKALTTALADLRKDPAIRKENEADQMLQKIAAFETQAKNKASWQQVLDGYTALKARFAGTRAAAKAEEGIKRAQDNIIPPKR